MAEVIGVLLPAGRPPLIRSRTSRARLVGVRHRRQFGGGVGDDPAVAHLDLPAHPGGDCGSWVTTRSWSRRASSPSSSRIAAPVAWSRLPVGSSASTIAGRPDERAGDRDPLTLAARHWWAGRQAVPSPTRCSAARPARAAAARPAPAYSSPSATLSSSVWCSARKNCWNTNPMLGPAARRAAGRPGRRRPRRRSRRCRWSAGPACRRDAAASSCPTRRDRHRDQFPGRTVRLTPRSAGTGGARVDLGDLQLQHRFRAAAPAGAPAGWASWCGCSYARHHHALAGGQVAGHLHRSGGVVEQPGGTATR